MKSKICLVCDIPNWAFDIIAKKIKKSLDDKYDIRIDYYDMREKPDEFYELLEKNDDCGLIHFFWRKSLLQFETDAFKQKVKDAGKNVDEYIYEKSKKISTGAYDFLFLDEKNINTFKNIFNKYANHYYLSSKRLYEKYMTIGEFKNPTGIVHDICDWQSFIPIDIKRFDDMDRNFVVGWVGNSATKIDGVDLKGFHTIIKPVIQELKNEGYNIEEYYADRNERWRATEEMPEYYSHIDVCLCTSIHEGTPLPVLEAMSCGVPIITTDVGIVMEALGEKQVAFIIGDRENGKNDEKIKSVLKEKIIELYNNRKLLKELSDENQESISNYDDGKIIQEFEDYFEKCLK